MPTSIAAESIIDRAASPRSRRAILAGAVGGIGALAATVIGGASRVQAAAGAPLIIGSTANNAGTSNTTLTTASSGTALLVTQNGSGPALRGSAVGPGSIAGFFTAQNGTGISGVTGNPNSYGAFAQNNGTAGTGGALRASGGNNRAVIASTNRQRGIAIDATSTFGFNFGQGGSAIRGVAGGGTAALIHPSWSDAYGDAAGEFAGATGVIGASSHPMGGVGVVGLAPTGVGVQGETQSWYGVVGKAEDGIGVWGTVTTGPAAVRGEAGNGDGVHGSAGGSGFGVRGESNLASGVYGFSSSGYAIEAAGRVKVDAYLDVLEMSDPVNPPANKARLFVRDTGGKTELCVIFPTGVVQVIKTEA